MKRSFLVVFLVFAAAAYAAEPPSPLDSLKQSNAQLHRFVLDNGMIGLVKEDHSAPVVAVQFWVGTGAINEDRFLGAGLSHFVEHMIFKGTPSRGVGQITRDIDDAGGTINAYTTHDHTVFHCTMPSAKWTTGLDVLADAVMNASFPTNEWMKERDVILRELAMGKDNPEREIGELLWSTAYRVHPYRFPVIGYEDIFKTVTHDDLAGFFRLNYEPDNIIAVVVGDVNAADVEARLRSTFSSCPRRARPPAPLPVEPPQVSPRLARKTGAYEVSRILWSYHTVALSHPDAAALDVLATVAGRGRSSRLVREIKEKQHLVFDIDAWSSTPKDAGLFGISATFDPTNEAAVIRSVQNEIDGWTRTPFTQEEIDKARRIVLMDELGQLQTMDGQAESYASGEFYAGDPLFSEAYLEAVNAVDGARLKAVAEKYLVPNNRTIAILAPVQTGTTTGAVAQAAPGSDVQKLTLSNGIPLLVREDHRLPMIWICAAFRGGLLSETATNNGVTQLLSDLLTRGTSTRSAEDIASAVERLGGSLSPFCGRNSFGLQAGGLSQDAATLMDLFSDCLLNPTFPVAEVEKQRTVQLADIQQQRERPLFIAEEAMRQALFPNHPYRWTPQGSRETVESLSRDALAAQYRRCAVRGNVVLSVFGDITAARARELVERTLAALPAGPAPAIANPAPSPQLPARVKHREPKQQTIVMAGYPGADIKDPRVDALAVIENALSGLSSDLSTEVREKRGLAYFCGAFDRPGLEPGLFALYAGTREEAADQVEKLFNDELARIRSKGLREEEFARACEQIVASHEMSLQDNGQLAQTCALDELYGLGYGYSFTIGQRMKGLTLDGIRKTADELFQPDRCAVSLVFPEKPDAKEGTTP